jgi:hypothetical protein
MSRTLSSRETPDDEDLQRLNDMWFMVLDTNQNSKFDPSEFQPLEHKDVLLDELDDELTDLCLEHIAAQDRLRSLSADLSYAHSMLRRHEAHSNIIETLRLGTNVNVFGTHKQLAAHNDALQQVTNYLNGLGHSIACSSDAGLQITGSPDLINEVIKNIVAVYTETVILNNT